MAVLTAAHDIISDDLSVSPVSVITATAFFKMVPRLITRIAILLAAACALITSAPAQTQPKPADEVVRVSTELVQTDFMVFDKQGNSVNGLKRDQFALKVDGKPRDFTFFDQVSAGSRHEEAQLAAARGNASGSGKGLAVPLDRGRTIVFFLDDYHLSNSSMNQVRRMLRSFADREMRQNDQVAVVTASGQIGFLQQITDNKAVIVAATERLRSFQSMALNSAEHPPMSEYHAFQVQMHDLDVLNFFIDALIKENPMLQRQQAAEIVKGRAYQILADGSSITTRTLAAFKFFLDSTVSLPSRKVVFFISDGFLLDRSGSDNFDRVQRVTAAAARSGTVIYSMDARGLGAGLPDASQMVPADPTGRLSRSSTGEVRAFQDGLNAMASDTGGRAFFNTNSLSNSVETGLKETSIYYLLAWRPESEEQRNPRFRRIEVSVVGRPDLVVRFRRGFGESPSDDDSKRAKAKAPPRQTPNQEVNAALRAPYPITALPISLALTFLDTAQYGNTLTSSIKVDTSSLAVEREGETPAAVLDLAGLVLNDQGKSVSSFNKRITVKAMANGVVGQLPENLFYNHFSLIKPGLYQVRVAAVDLKKGTRGSSHQWIEIPDLQTNGLTMSSLIVGEKKAEADIEPINANSTDPQAPAAIRQVSVNVDHRFARSSYLRFLTFIYNATTTSTPGLQPQDPKGSTLPASIGKGVPDLAIQVQIFRDNEPVITTPLRKMSTEGTPDPRRVPYAADVRLDDLQVGAYVLQVTIIDRLAKSSATQKLNFQIE